MTEGEFTARQGSDELFDFIEILTNLRTETEKLTSIVDVIIKDADGGGCLSSSEVDSTMHADYIKVNIKAFYSQIDKLKEDALIVERFFAQDLLPKTPSRQVGSIDIRDVIESHNSPFSSPSHLSAFSKMETPLKNLRKSSQLKNSPKNLNDKLEEASFVLDLVEPNLVNKFSKLDPVKKTQAYNTDLSLDNFIESSTPVSKPIPMEIIVPKTATKTQLRPKYTTNKNVKYPESVQYRLFDEFLEASEECAEGKRIVLCGNTFVEVDEINMDEFDLSNVDLPNSYNSGLRKNRLQVLFTLLKSNTDQGFSEDVLSQTLCPKVFSRPIRVMNAMKVLLDRNMVFSIDIEEGDHKIKFYAVGK
ncbi:hypothetical protein PCE1_001072 [Barthelona sp. PCE]